MTNDSKNCREGFKVVVEGRWSLNSSGRKHDFDCRPSSILKNTCYSEHSDITKKMYIM